MALGGQLAAAGVAAADEDPGTQEGAVGIAADGPTDAQDPTELPGVPASRSEAPNTDGCPNKVAPPKAQTTSERPRPGMTPPTPPPPAADTACGISAAMGYQVPAEQTASSWLVFDLDTGDIIAQKDPHGRYRPASIIKVLLALVAIDELDLDKQVQVSPKAANMEGSAVGIGVTGHYTVRQLLYGLLLASGNDAATALSEELGGEEATLEKVNDLARDLGAHDTYVGNFTGLDTAGQMTSAHDLAIMYRAAWQNPVFADIVKTKFIDFPGHHDNDPAGAGTDDAASAMTGDAAGAADGAGTSDGAGEAPPDNGFELWTDNGLLLNDPDGIGGKTGYTDDAHHTFVGALNRGGRRLGVVVLDTTIDKGRAWEQAQRFVHAAYEVPRGEKVALLEDPRATHDAAPTTASSAAAGTQSRGMKAKLLAFGAITAAILGVVLLIIARRSTGAHAR